MIWGADRHCIDIFSIQDFSIVFGEQRLPIHSFCSGGKMVGIDVAEGSGF